LILHDNGGICILPSSISTALDAVESISPAEVKEGSDENDALRISCIFGHDPVGIQRCDRSTVKRQISTSFSLVQKQYLSRARFAVKWITNVFINLNKEDRLASESFIQC
jgi:hypothetical protein